MILPPIPAVQPTTMTFVEYQGVQHALPDGTPDPEARDNFYVRETCTWYLVLDTETLTPDAAGVRHAHLPGYRRRFFSKFEQKGRPRGKVRGRFTVVYPDQKAKTETGGVSVPPVNDDYPMGAARHFYGVQRTVVERVETHSEGRRRATCVLRESSWARVGGGTSDRSPFVPTPQSGVVTDSKAPVRPAPPTYGYAPVTLPADDDF